jgi:hypothetical protein
MDYIAYYSAIPLSYMTSEMYPQWHDTGKAARGIKEDV